MERVIDFMVPKREMQKAFMDLRREDQSNGQILRDLYMALSESLGTLTPSQAEALSRLMWVMNNPDADPALIRNNLGKGLHALGDDSLKFF